MTWQLFYAWLWFRASGRVQVIVQISVQIRPPRHPRLRRGRTTPSARQFSHSACCLFTTLSPLLARARTSPSELAIVLAASAEMVSGDGQYARRYGQGWRVAM